MHLNKKLNLVIVILTYNEELHIKRCLSSALKLTNHILVVDSFSNDKTVEFSKQMGVTVLQNKWRSHSDQFNWALSLIKNKYEWVFRVDADEYLSEELISEIHAKLNNTKVGINGIYIKRIINFFGRDIRFGGVGNIYVLRIFRSRYGFLENRLMDEHFIIIGKTIKFNGTIIDRNLNNIDWWVLKHLRYASLEAIEMLDLEYNILKNKDKLNALSGLKLSKGFKRIVKNSIYASMPTVFRSLVYFLYRYLILFGFLDGFKFHFLQSFWYRFIVDVKINQVRKFIKDEKVSPKKAIKSVLNIDLHN